MTTENEYEQECFDIDESLLENLVEDNKAFNKKLKEYRELKK
jgi:hypothetical protein